MANNDNVINIFCGTMVLFVNRIEVWIDQENKAVTTTRRQHESIFNCRECDCGSFARRSG